METIESSGDDIRSCTLGFRDRRLGRYYLPVSSESVSTSCRTVKDNLVGFSGSASRKGRGGTLYREPQVFMNAEAGNFASASAREISWLRPGAFIE
jgi:hypothetical protein